MDATVEGNPKARPPLDVRRANGVVVRLRFEVSTTLRPVAGRFLLTTANTTTPLLSICRGTHMPGGSQYLRRNG